MLKKNFDFIDWFCFDKFIFPIVIFGHFGFFLKYIIYVFIYLFERNMQIYSTQWRIPLFEEKSTASSIEVM